MKKLILCFMLLLPLTSQAVELKFIGPCQEEFIMRTDVNEEFDNVGDLTIETLKKFSIPHSGSPEGIVSAFETPVGDAAIEVISPEEKRFYGWCYSVDGIAPEVYPHEERITLETKSVVWTFGFAYFKNGQWLSQCTPAYTVKPDFLCKDPTVGDAP